MKNDIVTQKAINNVINNNENILDIENDDKKNKNDDDNKEEIDPLLIVSMSEKIYAKITENTPMINIFNYFTKKINSYNILDNLVIN